MREQSVKAQNQLDRANNPRFRGLVVALVESVTNHALSKPLRDSRRSGSTAVLTFTATEDRVLNEDWRRLSRGHALVFLGLQCDNAGK